MIEYVIVFNWNMREEEYLMSECGLKRTDDKRMAIRYYREGVLRIVERLLGVGVSFAVVQYDSI